MTYLFKVTVAWILFLLLFELLYKNNAKYTANRLYLLMSMILGLLLPLIPSPSGTQTAITAMQSFYIESSVPALSHSQLVELSSASEISPGGMTIWGVVLIIYSMGVMTLTVRYLLELRKMMSVILKTNPQVINGYKVIVTGKIHAPCSFLGRIFISGTGLYCPEELDYILQHEAAHNFKKHWLDLWIIQLACIVFWFHPLIWRYRHLLQMQHEYEADQIAANEDPYAYGHFLLNQTLLNGVPSMAHSFHFSPIKNRINMLTKRRNLKKAGWKYLMLLPILSVCTLLMAKAIAREGSTMTYNRDVFKWRESDTLFYDEFKRRPAIASNPDLKKKVIYSMNDEQVYQNEYLKNPATYSYDNTHYINYIKSEFKKYCQNTADSTTNVVVTDLVINKEGKVVLYQVKYFKPFNKYLSNGQSWSPVPDFDPTLNSVMNRVIAEAPDWKPAMIDGQPVISVVNFGTGEGC